MVSQTRPRYQEALEIARDLWGRIRTNVWRSPDLAAFSLLIGVVLWLVVTEAENPTRVDTFGSHIQVEPVNVGEGLAVANSSLPTVQVRLEAPEDRWDELTAGNFRAYVDLNDLDAREQIVPVQVDVQGVSRVRVVGTIPSTVEINLEELQTKEVPVTTRLVGTPPRGYEPGRLIPEKETVEVSGPASLVSRVTEAAATVNVTGLTVGLEQSVVLVPMIEGGGEVRGVTVDPETVKVSVSITQTTLTRTLPLEAQLTGQPADGYRISGVRVTPATVQVEGTIDVLQALDTLELPRVDIGGQTADVATTVVPVPPEGVTITPGGTTVRVEVSITPIVGSMSLSLAPEVVNIPQGLVARVNPSSVTVIVEGPLARLNTLQSGSVRATVDASNLAAGTTDVRVTTTQPDGITVRQVQPGIVSLTLTSP